LVYTHRHHRNTIHPYYVAQPNALHRCIDELKARVPIWKNEWYEDGSSWYVTLLLLLLFHQRFPLVLSLYICRKQNQEFDANGLIQGCAHDRTLH
jgi:hypothetical protein